MLQLPQKWRLSRRISGIYILYIWPFSIQIFKRTIQENAATLISITSMFHVTTVAFSFFPLPLEWTGLQMRVNQHEETIAAGDDRLIPDDSWWHPVFWLQVVFSTYAQQLGASDF